MSSLCTGCFLSAMDSSIVTTIFNEIGTEFKNSNMSVWIMTSYMLSTSAVQPLYGKLSDIFGRKNTLVVILLFFLTGSWLCGAARTMVELSIARAIAGLGGGGLMTMASVAIHDLVPMRSRGQYQSYVNMAHTVGATVGAPLGGLINDMFGWRYCFYLNLPPCFFILYVYIYRLENYNLAVLKSTETLKEKMRSIDFVGALILLTANVTFATGVSLGGNTHPWTDPFIIVLLVVAAISFIGFGIYEFYGAEKPLVSRELIKNSNLVSVVLNNFFLCSSTMGIGYLIPQFFMGVLGYNASSAGLWVLPRTAMVTIGCWVAGRYLAVTGRYKKYVVVFTVVHVGATVSHFLWTSSTPMWIRFVSMSVEGYCFGTLFVATMVALVADISQKENASATSMMFLCRSTGWLTGSTVTAAVLQGSLKRNLTNSIKGPDAAKIIEFVRTSITKIRTLPPDIQIVVLAALEQSIHTTFWYAIICSVGCFLVTFLFMKDCHLSSGKNK
ncbi:major facilitator superfamily domain-containing protein [Phycomyces nitens]|nr:major facilitator superfamily domain-containing protein [Phycomyces nitens]